MKLLLLQARKPDDVAGPHERAAFADVIGVDKNQVVPWDLLTGAPPDDEFLSADCVMVGGSGDFGVAEARAHPWLREFIDAMGRVTDLDVPMFASCFGFQALVVACGGQVVTDKSRAEIGTFEAAVTEAGLEDPLFREVAPRFYAQFGHKDHATRLPTGFVHLARTERSEFQAFRIPGRQIYATQFHPELSMEANRERSIMYADEYTRAGYAETFEEVMASFRDSSAASNLLRRFVRDELGLIDPA